MICSHRLCSHLDESLVLTPNGLQTSALPGEMPRACPVPWSAWRACGFWNISTRQSWWARLLPTESAVALSVLYLVLQLESKCEKQLWRTWLGVCTARSLYLIVSCWFLWELPNQLSYSAGVKPNEKYSFLHCKHDCQAVMFFSASF